jgi:hypothetical protein
LSPTSSSTQHAASSSPASLGSCEKVESGLGDSTGPSSRSTARQLTRARSSRGRFHLLVRAHIFLVLLVGSLLESLKLALVAVIERRCIALADHADCASRCRA